MEADSAEIYVVVWGNGLHPFLKTNLQMQHKKKLCQSPQNTGHKAPYSDGYENRRQLS